MLTRFEKAAVVSTFIGAAIVVLASCYGLLFPHPTSMFFSTAHKISNIGLTWAVVSIMVFAGAVMGRLLFWER